MRLTVTALRRLAVPGTVAVCYPAPNPEAAGGAIYRRCSTVPPAPMSVTEARTHYGTVLRFVAISTNTSAREYYHAVPRGS
ncbi:hypothetical protein OG401_28640 [Kitasatospora purpeofusca]|uniref:hypothetical protein n=1 Tax=Kitasatospora purpeofusca TaxID=67352 RepID=UPI0022565AC4|nr:hypothetical protein [Kitasatospora purpeofusca]MCX4688216.1 hypothetical protein [Kitasatospora purpeofusca]